MKRIGLKRVVGLFIAAVLAVSILAGCSRKTEDRDSGENTLGDNIIITETGDIIERNEPEPTSEPEQESDSEADQTPESTPEIVEMDPQLLVEPELPEPTNPEQTEVPDELLSEPDNNRLQIVFMGDSIFDSNRDGTGVPALTALRCDARFYNLAIGGTTAAVGWDSPISWEEWSSIGLLGIVNAVVGNIPTGIFEGYTARIYLDDPDADYSQTDYFVIEYGTNDFLSGVPLSSDSRANDMRSYAGALHDAVVMLKRFAPDATIILCSPTYVRFFNGTWMIGDGNVTSNGYGTMYDYKGICEYIAGEQQVVFFNAYDDLGIDGYTAEEYLEDGIHLTYAGRELYADKLARTILNYEETKNN